MGCGGIPDFSSHLTTAQIASMHHRVPSFMPGAGINIPCTVNNAAMMSAQAAVMNAVNLSAHLGAHHAGFTARITPDSLVADQIATHARAVQHVDTLTTKLFTNEAPTVAPLVKENGPVSKIMLKTGEMIAESGLNKSMKEFFNINGGACHEDCLDALLANPTSHVHTARDPRKGLDQDLLDLISLKHCLHRCDKQ